MAGGNFGSPSKNLNLQGPNGGLAGKMNIGNIESLG
jgi:hypothetical protein